MRAARGCRAHGGVRLIACEYLQFRGVRLGGPPDAGVQGLSRGVISPGEEPAQARCCGHPEGSRRGDRAAASGSRPADLTGGVILYPQSTLSDFYRELGDMLGVSIRVSNRWGGI